MVYIKTPKFLWQIFLFFEGVGPITAYKLIKDHKSIEKVIEHLKKENENSDRKKKFVIPDPFHFADARELFMKPNVISDFKDIEV